MAKENETIADIIAEMRKPHDEICARCHEEPNESCPYCGDPNGCNSPEYGQWPGVMTQLADRLDAAHKRELKEAEVNAAPLPCVVLKLGNAAKLREAAKHVQSTMERLRDPTDKNNAEFVRIWEIVSAALAAPPRNCDVGTAEEQYSRMFRNCYEWMCKDCKSSDKDFRQCALSWAQKPYEEGGAK